jgi:hypothetical protein
VGYAPVVATLCRTLLHACCVCEQWFGSVPEALPMLAQHVLLTARVERPFRSGLDVGGRCATVAPNEALVPA